MLSYAYWSLSRAKCIIKYLSPARILFHVSQTRELLKAFDFNVSVRNLGHLLSFITLFLVTTTTS